MVNIQHIFPALVLLFLLFFGCIQQPVCGDGFCDKAEGRDSCMGDCFELGITERVIDGDTIELAGGEKVRLIGIDTPETGEPCYEEARGRLAELIGGRTIEMEKDVESRDKYNRLLRYIYLDGEFINLQMVEDGLAHAFPYGASAKYEDDFAAAEEIAMHGEGCLWTA